MNCGLAYQEMFQASSLAVGAEPRSEEIQQLAACCWIEVGLLPAASQVGQMQAAGSRYRVSCLKEDFFSLNFLYLSGSGFENIIGSGSRSGSKLIVKIVMCPSLELTLHYNHTFVKFFINPFS